MPRRELGVACFVSSLAGVLLLALTFSFIGFIESSFPDGFPSPIADAVHWGLGIDAFIALVGLTLDAVTFRRESARIRLAFYGMFLSFIVFLIVGSLLVNALTLRLKYL